MKKPQNDAGIKHYEEKKDGLEFEAAIRREKPLAVHHYQVFTEHGEVYSFSFVDRARVVHYYDEDISKWMKPVITQEKMRNFFYEYGVPLVSGNIIPINDLLYQIFKTHTKATEDSIEYKTWQRSLEVLREVKGTASAFVSQNGSVGTIDAKVGNLHSVLKCTAREPDLQRIIEGNLNRFSVVDVSSYETLLGLIKY